MVIVGAGPPNSEVEDDGVGAGAPNAPKIDVPGVVVVDPKIPPPGDGAGEIFHYYSVLGPREYQTGLLCLLDYLTQRCC